MLIYDIPKSACIRVSWNSFKNQSSSSGTQRTIRNIGMSGNPTDIGCAKMYLTGLVLKNIYKSIVRVHHISPAGMHHPFRFAGRARSI